MLLNSLSLPPAHVFISVSFSHCQFSVTFSLFICVHLFYSLIVFVSMPHLSLCLPLPLPLLILQVVNDRLRLSSHYATKERCLCVIATYIILLLPFSRQSSLATLVGQVFLAFFSKTISLLAHFFLICL